MLEKMHINLLFKKVKFSLSWKEYRRVADMMSAQARAKLKAASMFFNDYTRSVPNRIKGNKLIRLL